MKSPCLSAARSGCAWPAVSPSRGLCGRGAQKPAARPPATDRRHRARRHVDVGGGLARRPHARRRSAGQHLDAAGRRRRGHAHHRRLQRRAPAGVVARRQVRSRSSPIATAATTSGRSRRTASNQRKLTWGAFDDREPAWSHDGTRVAFSSDRGNPLGSDYNIWIARHARRGALAQLTKDPAEDYMPTLVARRHARSRSPRRATTDSRCGRSTSPTGAERKVGDAPAGRVDAPSWGPGGQIVYHVHGGRPEPATRSTASRSPAARTCSRSAPSWASPTEFFYVSDGKIRKRSVGGGRRADGRVHARRCR